MHRAMYRLVNGAVPDGLAVLHHCDVPLCVNPEHLFLGTDAANMADKTRKGRQAKGVDCNHPHRVLDEEAVRQIRALRAEGMQIKELMARYGASKGTILSVVHRRTWRHVS